MNYKTSYWLVRILGIGGILVMLIGGITGRTVIGVFLEIGWLLWPGAVVVMADVLQTLLFFRCPYCGGHWDPRGGIPHYCPECGEYIR